MKEKDCWLTMMKFSYCKICEDEILHEFGYSKEDHLRVKMCIKCDTVTIIGRKNES